MAGSIVWTLGHQETLAALGGVAHRAGRPGRMARRPGRGVELHRAALVRRAQGAGGESRPSRHRLRARHRRLSGRSPGAPPPPGAADAAGGACERLAGARAAGAGRAGRPAPRRPRHPALDPTGARAVELVHGFWSLVSDVAGPTGRTRQPDPTRPPGDPTGSRRAAPGRARRPEQADRDRGPAPAPRSAPMTARMRVTVPNGTARLGDFSIGLQRERARGICWSCRAPRTSTASCSATW